MRIEFELRVNAA